MTALQLLALSIPVMAFVFMGAIALAERRFDRAPISVCGGFGSTASAANTAVASGYENAEPKSEEEIEAVLAKIAEEIGDVIPDQTDKWVKYWDTVETRYGLRAAFIMRRLKIANSNGEAAKDTALKQIADIVQSVAPNVVRGAR
jgi:hypothetical protein